MDCSFSAWFARLENCKKKADGLFENKKSAYFKNRHSMLQLAFFLLNSFPVSGLLTTEFG